MKRKVERTPGFLIGALSCAWNGFSNVAWLQRPSSSAGIRNRETQIETPADAGFHIFVVVRNGQDIPRFVKDLNRKLIAAGYGWAFIDMTGGVEVRSIIDERASNNLARLWFEGAAILDDPRLEFVPDGRKAVVHNTSAHFLDTGALHMPNNPDDPVWAAWMGEVDRLQAQAAPHAAVIRREYREAKVSEIVAAGGSDAEARKTVKLALEKHTLSGDFPIRLDGGVVATVAEILADRPTFHRKTCADPLEWDYGSGANVGICFTDGEPHIFSHAHGGRDFRLAIDPTDWYEPLPDAPGDKPKPTDPTLPSSAASNFAAMFGRTSNENAASTSLELATAYFDHALLLADELDAGIRRRAIAARGSLFRRSITIRRALAETGGC